MTDIERSRVFQQQAMAVDIEIAVAQTGGGITEDQGQAAMTAAWPYVEGAIQSERERAKVLVDTLKFYSSFRPYGIPDIGVKADKALAAYGDGHE